MRICTLREYRFVIPETMRTDIARTIFFTYLMAPVMNGTGDYGQAVAQIDAIIKATAEKNGLLAAMLTQELKVEVRSTIKDMGENTIEFKKVLVSYEDFLAGNVGD